MSDSGRLAEDTARLHIEQDDARNAHPAAEPTPARTTVSEPTVVGNKRLWDITGAFRGAAATLPTGHLIKDDFFTLFESVGALEIMDPKMDSGFLRPGETLYDAYDVLRDLRPAQVLGVIDQLWQYEMVWHRGYPLAQSLFSCHYIDALLSLEPRGLHDCQFYRGDRPAAADSPMLRVLRAYCVALIKSCGLVVQLVLDSHFFEEEDFSTHTFNRDLLTRVHEDDVLNELDEAITLTATTLADPESREICDALSERLAFREKLLTAFARCFSEVDLPDWDDVRSMTARIGDSHKLGTPVPDAFSRKIQRKLMSTVPPRPIIELSWDESIDTMNQLCAEGLIARQVFEVSRQGPESLKTFLLHFSARVPNTLPFSRSYISNALLEQHDDFFVRMIQRDLELLVLPASVVMDPSNWTVEKPLSPNTPNPRFEMARIIDTFAGRALPDFGGYIDFWRALCSNRSRLRRMLCHVVLRFDELQRDADDLDATLASCLDGDELADIPESPLYQWAYNHKLRIMECIIQLGFELDVYLPDEFAGMYWLLSSISRRRYSILQQVHDSLGERLHHLRERGGDPASPDEQAVKASVDYLKTQLELVSGNENLAEGLYTIYTFLHYLHLIPNPSSTQPYHDPALRYELRMKPFLTLQDGFVEMYDDFVAVTHPFGDFGRPASNPVDKALPLCDIADKVVRDARTRFSQLRALGAVKAQAELVEKAWGTDVSNLIKASVSAGVAVSTVKKAALEERLGDLVLTVPPPGKRYHEFWVIPTLSLR